MSTYVKNNYSFLYKHLNIITRAYILINLPFKKIIDPTKEITSLCTIIVYEYTSCNKIFELHSMVSTYKLYEKLF